MIESPGPWRRWILAARLRTLPTAVVPVAVGTLSVRPATLNWFNTILCALVALSMQIGTNYANDYSDGVRGTDKVRVGPFRLTASGLVGVKKVRLAAFIFFGVSAMLGLGLAARTSWWLVPIGVSAIFAGWFYTGGPRPYGYFGFGELFVMLYFGFVATVATAYSQHHTIPTRAWWLALAAGSAACTMLEANNLRDISGDQVSGKMTLAARVGRRTASFLVALFVLLMAVGAAVGVAWWAAFVVVALYLPSLRLAFSSRTGRELLGLLVVSARAQLLLGVVLSVSCVFVP